VCVGRVTVPIGVAYLDRSSLHDGGQQDVQPTRDPCIRMGSRAQC